MRTTIHNGRKNSSGQVFKAQHNDRDFSSAGDGHIDQTLSDQNVTDTCYGRGLSFLDAEKQFYEEHFTAALRAKNAAAEKARHPERIKTMDEYRTSARTCPEETIMQIGAHGDTISPDIALAVMRRQISWERRTFPQVKVVDVALHLDEPEAAPHMHIRKVWVAHDKAGREIVGQNRALQEMGIDRPDPSKPVSRYNNGKTTYTAACREHFQQLCKEYGLEIETVAKDPGQSGAALARLKAETAQKAEKAARDKEQAALRRTEDLARERGLIVDADRLDPADLGKKELFRDAYTVDGDILRSLMAGSLTQEALTRNLDAERRKAREKGYKAAKAEAAAEKATLEDKLQKAENRASEAAERASAAEKALIAARRTATHLQHFIDRAARAFPVLKGWQQLFDRYDRLVDGFDFSGTRKAYDEMKAFERQHGLVLDDRNRDKAREEEHFH